MHVVKNVYFPFYAMYTISWFEFHIRIFLFFKFGKFPNFPMIKKRENYAILAECIFNN